MTGDNLNQTVLTNVASVSIKIHYSTSYTRQVHQWLNATCNRVWMLPRSHPTSGLLPKLILILLSTFSCSPMVCIDVMISIQSSNAHTIYIDKGDSAWTTRFGIVAKDGDSLVPESEKTQPDGKCNLSFILYHHN